MRLLFLLLLLVNVAFYAYTHVARQQAATESQTAQLQINPDQVRLLKSAEDRPSVRRRGCCAGRLSRMGAVRRP
jgi:cbb3-type cytochrome oxidase subunit 3